VSSTALPSSMIVALAIGMSGFLGCGPGLNPEPVFARIQTMEFEPLAKLNL
jgi:hypothetical protein